MDLPKYIVQCLEKYDRNNKIWKKKLKGYTNVETDKNKKIVYFKNIDKIIYKNNYEVIGLYYESINLWLWGWAVPTKIPAHFSKKLLDYGFNTQINNFIKTILCNSRINIKSQLELDVFLALISDIGKMFLYKETINDVTYYIKI